MSIEKVTPSVNKKRSHKDKEVQKTEGAKGQVKGPFKNWNPIMFLKGSFLLWTTLGPRFCNLKP